MYINIIAYANMHKTKCKFTKNVEYTNKIMLIG